MNKCFLKEKKELKIELKELGLKKFVKRYIKPDILIGPADSVKFINKKIKLFNLP